MRIAALSDIHGNLPALEAVLADVAAHGVDRIVNLGDIASGPLWPRETLARLIPLGLPTIAGNHERQLLAGRGSTRLGASDAFAAAELDEAQWAWLATLPPAHRLTPEVHLCHGTPASDLVYWLETVVPGAPARVRLASTDEVRERAAGADLGGATLVLCGHTHVARTARLAGGVTVVNAGSVGLQAFDHDDPIPHVVENGSPHARYALCERTAAGWSVSLRAVPYDWHASAARAEANGRPEWARALRTGRMD
jgi:predicted phosphodiesterase